MPDIILFPYQVEGAAWLSLREQALLADEMGLGKSAQAIHACDLIGAANILVVCPASVRVNWMREFVRFSDVARPLNLIETGKSVPIDGVNVISYDLLVNEGLRKKLKAMAWDVLIVDEAHYLKERTAKRTKAIYGHHKHLGLMHSAKRTWRLTGTPMPNNPSELWTHLKSMGAEERSYWDFVFAHCDGFDGTFGYKITGAKHAAIPTLREQLGKVMLRRKKADVMKQLPPIVFHEITVPKDKVQLDPYFYENYYSIGVPAFLEKLANLDTSLRAGLVAVQTTEHANFRDALKLIEGYAATTPTLRRYIGLAKMKACHDIIEEDLKSGEIDKIVIFAVHQQVIEETRLRFRKYGAVSLFGGTPVEKRQRKIDKFQNDVNCRVFVGQIVAAGVGITLTAANEVAFIESSWVPADNAQAAMRVHRVGQTKKVRCRFFTCADSVDEQVMRVVVHKSRDIAKILD